MAQMVPRTICPLCGGERQRAYGQRGDYRLAECRTCRLVFVREMLPESFAQAHYQGQSCASYLEWDAELRSRTRRLLGQVLRLGLLGRRALDVGCGSGLFLEMAKEAGLEAVGLDLDKGRVDYCRDRGLEALHGSLPDARLAPESFDLIWVSHLIEHIAEPNPFLAKVVALMRPGAILALPTPNVRSLANRILRCHHRHIIPPEHLCFYSAWPLAALAARHGLACERITSYAPDDSQQLKEILAYLLKLQFLKPPAPALSTARFVDGKGGGARLAYRVLMAASRAAGPVLALFGGSELVGYFRKPATRG